MKKRVRLVAGVVEVEMDYLNQKLGILSQIILLLQRFSALMILISVVVAISFYQSLWLIKILIQIN